MRHDERIDAMTKVLAPVHYGEDHARATAHYYLNNLGAQGLADLARAAAYGLEDFEPLEAEDQEKRKLPPPMGVSDLLAVEEPEEEWLVEGLVPAGANVLVAGYPKTFKTMFILELGVALASGTPFLGRFPVPERRRVGIVLMEDQAHRVRWRLKRLCAGREIALRDLDGWLFHWFRPPLRLNDQTVLELADYGGELDLDTLWVDSWAYVAVGDSNSSDDVTPQLQALSHARAKRPGLSVGLTHHARKERGEPADELRLTDIIRNSGAFGAWYDVGLVLGRKNEMTPVTVRAELRDYAMPEPFAFEVIDGHPAGPENNFRSGGWLRLRASEEKPQTLERRAAAEKLLPAVEEFLQKHPEGVSRKGLREGVKGNNADVEAAFDLLAKAGKAERVPSPGRGRPAVYRPSRNDLAQPCPNVARATPERGVAHLAPTPVGGKATVLGKVTPGVDSEAIQQERVSASLDLNLRPGGPEEPGDGRDEERPGVDL